jgi:hypothetical protein
MSKMTLIGLDLAKSVFQIHGVDAEGKVILKKRLTRTYGGAYPDSIQQLVINC